MSTTDQEPAQAPAEDPATAKGPELTTAALAGAQGVPQAREGEARSFDDARPGTSAIASSRPEEPAAPLFAVAEAADLRAKWDAVQTGFVDEPRKAVEQADVLVAGAMQHLAEKFAEERARLEGQWDQGDNVSTEDLRVALRRYRSFFTRLLSV